MVFPFTSSVAMLEVAMAAPQPKVLKLMSFMMSSSIFIYIFIMSPQRGFPTVPIALASGSSPTFLGL